MSGCPEWETGDKNEIVRGDKEAQSVGEIE